MAKHKRSLFPLFFSAIVGAAIGGFAANYIHVSPTNTKTSERKILFYQSPMHPWITSDKPGKCTICGMALAPVFEGEEPIQQDGNFLKLSDKTAAVINIQTTAARLAPLHRTLRVAGMITDDETRHRILSARVPGRIEKLYVNQVGIEVTQQQPLADIFSPDVLTSQRLYLENLRAGASGAVSPSEIATSREQLLAVGLVEEDIQRLEQTQKPEKIFALRTPFDGTVVSRKVYEGQYVKVDDELFEIGDFSSLWFIFDAYEQDLPLLKINQSVDVTIPSFEGETVSAPITFIDPNLNENTRTARVRVVLPNPQRRILNRQTANGLIHLDMEPAVLIPRSALLYTHQFPAAYVDLGNGAYQFRQLHLGKIGDADVEILDGIQEGERVVTHAALLIDSQSQLAHIAEGQKEDAVTEMVHAKTEVPVFTGEKFPAAFLKTVLIATSALSADNLAEYQKHVQALKKGVEQLPADLKELLSSFAEKLESGTDLKSARRPFEPFSNRIADMVRSQPVTDRQAKIFQCPMSPVLGTARWIQPDNAEVLNPFFGSEMLNCGSELQ